MGWFSAITQWTEERYEKKMTKHRDEGTCPDCQGSGLNAMASIDYVGYTITNDGCPGCRSTGMYKDWEARQQW